MYDSQPQATGPEWVRNNWDKRCRVVFHPQALEQLKHFLPRFKLYPNTEEGYNRALSAMTQALSLDMRSAHRGRGKVRSDEEVYRWDFDQVTACWKIEDGVIHVKSIEPRSKRAMALAKQHRENQQLQRSLQAASK